MIFEERRKNLEQVQAVYRELSESLVSQHERLDRLVLIANRLTENLPINQYEHLGLEERMDLLDQMVRRRKSGNN